jgi:outer membrane biosynthesis protein TonB
MKKAFKFAALAAFAMMVAVACNNAPEENTDTTPVDTTPVDTMVEDTTPVIDTVPAVEEPKATTTKTSKKNNKKQEPVKTSASEMNVNNAGGQSGTLSAGNTNAKKNTTNASSLNVNNAGNGAGSLSLKKN